MEIINASRRSGKTTRIINEILKDDRALMITHSEMSKRQICRQLPELSKRIMTLQEYQQKRNGDLIDFDIVHIDDLELCMRVGHKIGLITMTNYPEIETSKSIPKMSYMNDEKKKEIRNNDIKSNNL